MHSLNDVIMRENLIKARDCATAVLEDLDQVFQALVRTNPIAAEHVHGLVAEASALCSRISRIAALSDAGDGDE